MRIEMFTGPSCSYCEAAKRLLAERELAYAEIDVATAEGLARFRECLPRVKAVPQILIDGAHIGGYEDLRDRLGPIQPRQD